MNEYDEASSLRPSSRRWLRRLKNYDYPELRDRSWRLDLGRVPNTRLMNREGGWDGADTLCVYYEIHGFHIDEQFFLVIEGLFFLIRFLTKVKKAPSAASFQLLRPRALKAIRICDHLNSVVH